MVETRFTNGMTTATFHPTSGPTLACDLCGCVIDATDRGRTTHQAWHAQNDKVIDLTEQHELKLAEAS